MDANGEWQTMDDQENKRESAFARVRHSIRAQYSLATARANGLTILSSDTDIYAHPGTPGFPPDLLTVQTFYERMFLEMGLPITYLSFLLDHDGPFVYPDFDATYWRNAEGPRRSFSHQPRKKSLSL